MRCFHALQMTDVFYTSPLTSVIQEIQKYNLLSMRVKQYSGFYRASLSYPNSQHLLSTHLKSCSMEGRLHRRREMAHSPPIDMEVNWHCERRLSESGVHSGMVNASHATTHTVVPTAAPLFYTPGYSRNMPYLSADIASPDRFIHSGHVYPLGMRDR